MRIGIPSLIATIGTQFFFAGVALVVTNAKGGSLMAAQQAAPALNSLLVGKLFDFVPAQFLWMILIAIAVWILLNRHRFGAHVYLIGDNNNSARLMGINVDQRRMILFMIVGVAAAFAGLLATLSVSYFYPTLGSGYLLQTLAAVFLGGTPVLGGVGTILGDVHRLLHHRPDRAGNGRRRPDGLLYPVDLRPDHRRLSRDAYRFAPPHALKALVQTSPARMCFIAHANVLYRLCECP